ncbi:hypothetical protein [Celeribacter sp.]|uniref:hypothetical protein n=1 Tax=Celeribacter sp. TaxID=1890673 RepID=UPI003A8E3143
MPSISRLALTAGLSAGATATFTFGTAAFGDTSGWEVIQQITIDEIVTEQTYEVRKSYPKALPAEGVEMELTGYVVPMYPGEKITELLMVSDMGLCPFCGSADHGASLQITLAEPITTIDEGARITVRGIMDRVNDPETWQAVKMNNAAITAGA